MIITEHKLVELNVCESAVNWYYADRMELSVENCQCFIDFFHDKENLHLTSWKSISWWLTSDVYKLGKNHVDFFNIADSHVLDRFLAVYDHLCNLPVEKRAPLLCSLLIDELEEL